MDDHTTVVGMDVLYVNKEDPLTGDTIRNLIGTCNDGRPQYGAATT